MVTEKTAQKREQAVLNATKVYFDKIGSGIEFLKRTQEAEAKRAEARAAAMEQAMEDNYEFEAEEYMHRRAIEQTLASQLDSVRRKTETNTGGVELIMSEMNIRCENCGAFMSPVQIVCHNCGAFSHIFPYNVEDAERISHMAAQDIFPLSEKLKVVSSNNAPYNEVQKHFDAMAKIEAVANLYGQYGSSETHKISYKKIATEAKRFLINAQNKAVEIAVVGNVKAGKSMLINALLGDRMASVDATPETSVLVKYRTTKNKYYTKVSFYTEEQWDALFNSAKAEGRKTAFVESYEMLKADSIKNLYLNKSTAYEEYETKQDLKSAITKWTSSTTPEHFFVSEVELGFVSNDLPHDVMLVDTPGLQDPVEFRSNITRKYINKAHWVLACISNENLNSKNELDFLSQVCANLQHDIRRLFIVATKADIVEEDDRKKKQKLFLKDIAPLYGDEIGIIKDCFISVAAQAHLLSKEKWVGIPLSKGDNKSLKKATYEFDIDFDDPEISKDEILSKFKINALLKRLESKVIKKRRNEIIAMISEDYKKANLTIATEVKVLSLLSSEQLLSLHDESEAFFEENENLEREYNEKKNELSDLKELLESYQINVSKGEE